LSTRIPHYREVGRKKSTIILCDASGARDLELGVIGFPFGHS
jgi:hypothetical protein